MNERLASFLINVDQKVNIDLSVFENSFIENIINERLASTNTDTIDAYEDILFESKIELEKLTNSLFVGYSEFFRNPLTYSVLEKIVFPELIQQKNRSDSSELRIWSAACSSGQEPFSIAMLLEELKTLVDYNYRIFATDYSTLAIQDAVKGNYTHSMVKNVTLNRIERWFSVKNSVYSVVPKLKECIDFSVFDLLNKEMDSPQTSIFGSFDMVICANLLFYYKPASRKEIISKLMRSISPNGYFITDSAERDFLVSFKCHEIFPHSGIFRV